MLRAIISALAMLGALSVPHPATALTTICSDPNRAGVLDRMSVRIPNGDERAFAERMRRFADVSSMSHGEVEGFDGPVWQGRTIIFQSPEFSVAIKVETRPNSNVARVTVERTCINDALEDWRPHWDGFRRFVGETFPS
jgi:hypothetical protein